MGEKNETGELSNDGGEVECGGWVPEGPPGRFQVISGPRRLLSVEDVGGSRGGKEEVPASCQWSWALPMGCWTHWAWSWVITPGSMSGGGGGGSIPVVRGSTTTET